jgi:hypothetical protein
MGQILIQLGPGFENILKSLDSLGIKLMWEI